jgi:hypothetical protein
LEIKTNDFFLKTDNLLINSKASGKEKVIEFTRTSGGNIESLFSFDAQGFAKIGGWNIADTFIDTYTGTRKAY